MIRVYRNDGELRYLSALGSKILGSPHWGGTTTQALTTDRLLYIPFKLEYAGDIDAITFRVTTGAGTLARCGLYELDPDGNPGDLLIETGDLDPSSIGGKTSAAFTTQSFDRGWYYIAIVSDDTTTVRANTAADLGPNPLGIVLGALQGTGVLYENLGGSWSALPATAAAVPTYDSAIAPPRVCLRAA